MTTFTTRSMYFLRDRGSRPFATALACNAGSRVIGTTISFSSGLGDGANDILVFYRDKDRCKAGRNSQHASRAEVLGLFSDDDLVAGGEPELIERKTAGDRLSGRFRVAILAASTSHYGSVYVRTHGGTTRGHDGVSYKHVRSDSEVAWMRDFAKHPNPSQCRRADVLGFYESQQLQSEPIF